MASTNLPDLSLEDQQLVLSFANQLTDKSSPIQLQSNQDIKKLLPEPLPSSEKISLTVQNDSGSVFTSSSITINTTASKYPYFPPSYLIEGTPKSDYLTDTSNNDLILAGSGNDWAIAWRGGSDIIYGEAGNDFLYAGAEDDYVYGGNGNDSIHGSGGNDFLYGDSTSYSYQVYIRENTATDSETSLLSSWGDDRINGGTGNDYIDGGGGNDKIDGSDGDDTIVGSNQRLVLRSLDTPSFETVAQVANIRDAVREKVNLTAERFTIDNLKLSTDSTKITPDIVTDQSIAESDRDTLTGGNGADTFVFYNQDNGIDTIADFNADEGDRIQVSRSGFGDGLFYPVGGEFIDDSGELTKNTVSGLSLGLLKPEQFILGTSAAHANDRFIYNDKTGDLFFDIDGTGSQKQVQFAQLSGAPNLTYQDIFII
ncbi:hypothetical protein H6G41_31850 [Tolypothrix sp. FACHB-123]|uniref:calcium-binding protein n=1 Tax=Tolypothrix sp. FACHB-123 TaxID=2692868 RepID=UPI0016870EE6|nr:calcium-binding protein [Tolypothrix sp. FACHB-123]MBD2359130.1 hypothetical protein [Tolypothrix sp. FACHB-123]